MQKRQKWKFGHSGTLRKHKSTTQIEAQNKNRKNLYSSMDPTSKKRLVESNKRKYQEMEEESF